jgi:hypothetical protein
VRALKEQPGRKKIHPNSQGHLCRTPNTTRPGKQVPPRGVGRNQARFPPNEHTQEKRLPRSKSCTRKYRNKPISVIPYLPCKLLILNLLAFFFGIDLAPYLGLPNERLSDVKGECVRACVRACVRSCEHLVRHAKPIEEISMAPHGPQKPEKNSIHPFVGKLL